MHAALNAVLASLEVADPQLHGPLALFPLLAPDSRPPGYLLLAEALRRKLAHVTEVSEGGSVPELLLDNPSDAKILLLDGDELVGARQNRVLNVTILIGERTRTKIPVSCVERGRWSYVSREFASEDRMMFSRGRAEKMAQVTRSLRSDGARHADQGAVWDAVARKAAALGARSRSEAMRDTYAHVDADLADFRGAFHPGPRQVGAVFAIRGHAAGLELFDAPATFAATLGKLVGSYALDAIEHDPRPRRPVRREIARDLLHRTASLRSEEVPAAGEGTELRLEGPGLAGLALVAGGRVVHLSVLEHLEAGGEEPDSGDGQRRSARGAAA
jgi:ARG/rhodanese/phosphatase superfamily protein